jgi:hypothetical protein
MKIIGNGFNPINGNARRQKTIQSPRPGVKPTIHRCIKVHHLLECVDARVGAPGTHNLPGLTRELTYRFLNMVLYRLTIRLALPAPPK